MTLTTFFKSRVIRAGSIAGVVGLGAGAGVSYAMALRVYSFCATAAVGIINTIGKNITIPGLETEVQYEQYNLSLTLNNINVVLPPPWIQAVATANELPPECFIIPLEVGLAISLAISLGLASVVAQGVSEWYKDKPSLQISPAQASINADTNADTDDEEAGLIGSH